MILNIKPKLDTVDFSEGPLHSYFLSVGSESLFLKIDSQNVRNVTNNVTVLGDCFEDCTPVEIEEVTVRESL